MQYSMLIGLTGRAPFADSDEEATTVCRLAGVAARTFGPHPDHSHAIVDGPFTETKEQLFGTAIQFARRLDGGR